METVIRKIKSFANKNILEIKVNYKFLTLIFVFFAFGIYGYPDISLDHNTVIGFAIRTTQKAIIYFIIGFWMFSILYLSKSNNWSRTIFKFTARVSDLISISTMFVFFKFLKQREYTSSISGDEINFYGSSLQASRIIFEKTIPYLSWIYHVNASVVIAIFQLIIIACIVTVIKQLILTESKYRLALFFAILIVTHFMNTKYIGGSGSYPNLEVIPYFFLSPIQLLFNFSPKYISLLLFCIFLQIMFHISEGIIKNKYLRIMLISIFASLNVFIDIASSLNHGVYFIYFTSIFIFLYESRKLEFTEMFSLVLIFSLFRPTLLVLLIFLFFNRNGFETKMPSKFQILWKEWPQLFKIGMIHFLFVINVIIDGIYSVRDPKSKPSFTNNLEIWINNLTNLDFQSFIIVFFGIIILILLKKTYLFQIYLLSVALYLLMAPRGNLSNPIYKAEITTPLLIGILSQFFLFLSMFYEKIKVRVHLNRYLSIFGLVTFLFIVTYQIHENDKTTKLPNYSWDPRYYSYEVLNKKLDGYQNSVSSISFGKVDYNNDLLNFALINDCKFLDVVTNKTLYLKSGISSISYLKIPEPIALGSTLLYSLNSVKCVIVANYPLDLFLLQNKELDLEFKLLREFYNKQLQTSAFIFSK
jgi:hypothetical protein